jgi:hypothetical protein
MDVLSECWRWNAGKESGISGFLMSVRPSHSAIGLPLGWFSRNFDIWVFFKNLSGKFRFYSNQIKNNGNFTWRPVYIFYHISLICFQNDKWFKLKCGENQNTHMLYSVSFISKIALFMRFMEKCGRTGQATDGSVTRVHRTLDAESSLRVCNTHCFSTATEMARKHLHITLRYIACLVRYATCV